MKKVVTEEEVRDAATAAAAEYEAARAETWREGAKEVIAAIPASRWEAWEARAKASAAVAKRTVSLRCPRCTTDRGYTEESRRYYTAAALTPEGLPPSRIYCACGAPMIPSPLARDGGASRASTTTKIAAAAVEARETALADAARALGLKPDELAAKIAAAKK